MPPDGGAIYERDERTLARGLEAPEPPCSFPPLGLCTPGPPDLIDFFLIWHRPTSRTRQCRPMCTTQTTSLFQGRNISLTRCSFPHLAWLLRMRRENESSSSISVGGFFVLTPLLKSSMDLDLGLAHHTNFLDGTFPQVTCSIWLKRKSWDEASPYLPYSPLGSSHLSM